MEHTIQGCRGDRVKYVSKQTVNVIQNKKVADKHCRYLSILDNCFVLYHIQVIIQI